MSFRVTNPSLRLRLITGADKAVLCSIYASTRTEEMAQLIHWTLAQKEAFLQWQFDAQHVYYQQNYHGASFWLIERKGKAIGRLYLHPTYSDGSMRIIDITMLPEWRNKGIGRQLLQDVMVYAEQEGRLVSIHVESFNPAMKLYQRLGFQLVSKTNEVYHLLEWKSNKAVLT
jgi:ribosomal protein S18 acetylase RimI-like enzyme